MAKKSREKSLDVLITKLGTNWGLLLTAIGIGGIGFTAGKFMDDRQTNLDLVRMESSHFLEIQQMTTEIQLLRIENAKLINKLEDHEKEK